MAGPTRAIPATSIYLWEEGRSTRLSVLNSWLNDRWLVEPQEYWYDSLEGAKVHAWLMNPPPLLPVRARSTLSG